MDLTREDLLAMYRWMYLTRILDLRVCELSKERTVHELQHASTGQEARTRSHKGRAGPASMRCPTSCPVQSWGG